MSRRSKLLVLLAPILLAGCGEDYEMFRTTDVTPYGNSRTAGSGVVYVRAKMLPERAVNIEPAAGEQTQLIEETREILNEIPRDAAPIFSKKLRK